MEEQEKLSPFGYVEGSYNDILAKLEWIGNRMEGLGTPLVSLSLSELVDFGVSYCRQAKQFVLEQEYSRHCLNVKLEDTIHHLQEQIRDVSQEQNPPISVGLDDEFKDTQIEMLRRLLRLKDKRNEILHLRLSVAQDQLTIADLEAQLEHDEEYGYRDVGEVIDAQVEE